MHKDYTLDVYNDETTKKDRTMNRLKIGTIAFATLLMLAFGATSLSAGEKCGAGKCGGDKKEAKACTSCDGKKAKAKASEKCGSGKCGGDKKEPKAAGKCGVGKCG